MLRERNRLAVSEGRIGRALLLFLALGFASLLIAGFAAARINGEIQGRTNWVAHTYQVALAIDAAEIAVEATENDRRAFLLTRQAKYVGRYRADDARIMPAVAHIGQLTSDNPRQQHYVAVLADRASALHDAREGVIELGLAGRWTESIAQFVADTRYRRIGGIRAVTRAMSVEEQRLLGVREADERASIRSFYSILAVAGVLLVLVATLSAIVILRYTRDLTASRDGLRYLNETLEEQVADRTKDLSRANAEIQRFAYIVSHDLRSPLVNVMGFTAELEAAAGALGKLVDVAERDAPAILTKEAVTSARADLPEAIGFIRSSTQKMDRLIYAILRLAREGRRTIMAEAVDIAAIADGAVAALRHIIDERGMAVDVERPMPALISDRLAVEQILSNLIENATKYRHPARPGHITVSASDARGRVTISVADNGRGIAPGDHERIFDLFRRSGAQDQPGEGIGLAHVRALAYRLGGTIDVQSVLGEGATFRLSLPPVYQPPQES